MENPNFVLDNVSENSSSSEAKSMSENEPTLFQRIDSREEGNINQISVVWDPKNIIPVPSCSANEIQTVNNEQSPQETIPQHLEYDIWDSHRRYDKCNLEWKEPIGNHEEFTFVASSE